MTSTSTLPNLRLRQGQVYRLPPTDRDVLIVVIPSNRALPSVLIVG